MSEKVKSHLERFRHNAALADRLELALPGDLDWCCVVKFYAALHLVDAYLSTKTFSFVIDKHEKRNLAIAKSPELRRLGTSYRELQDLSEQVRYDPGFVYKPEHHNAAARNLARVVSVLESKVKAAADES